jgi:peptidoglycan/LPS O-acetylase OafA/YrhL
MEEQFYLVWPCCLLGLLRSHVRPPVIASLTAVSFVLAVTWHHLAATQFDASVAEVLYRPDLRVDGLLLGVTIGVLHGFGLFEGRVPARLVQPAAGGAVVAIAVFMRWPLVLPTSVQHTLAVAFVALGSGIVVIERVRAPGAVLGRILEWRPLVWLGQLSYVLYLTHVPALKITRGVLDGASPALSTVVALAVAVAVSVAVHELVERPALRRKERYSIEPLPPSEDRSLGRA